MMAEFVLRCWRGMRMGSMLWTVLFGLASAFVTVSAERRITKMEVPSFNVTQEPATGHSFLTKAASFLWQSDESGYHHMWPVSQLCFFVLDFVAIFVYLINPKPKGWPSTRDFHNVEYGKGRCIQSYSHKRRDQIRIRHKTATLPLRQDSLFQTQTQKQK